MSIWFYARRIPVTALQSVHCSDTLQNNFVLNIVNCVFSTFTHSYSIHTITKVIENRRKNNQGLLLAVQVHRHTGNI